MGDFYETSREAQARLIYQTWEHGMVGLGQGQHLYHWESMPGDAKEAFQRAVAVVFNQYLEGCVRQLADQLGVAQCIRQPEPLSTTRPPAGQEPALSTPG
jgi:hypothetical protein